MSNDWGICGAARTQFVAASNVSGNCCQICSTWWQLYSSWRRICRIWCPRMLQTSRRDLIPDPLNLVSTVRCQDGTAQVQLLMKTMIILHGRLTTDRDVQKVRKFLLSYVTLFTYVLCSRALHYHTSVEIRKRSDSHQQILPILSKGK